MTSRYDWTIIQHDYDAGLSYTDLYAKYGVSSGSLKHARRTGKFVPRSRSDAAKIKRTQPNAYVGNRKLSHDDLAIMQRDYDAGMSAKAVADKYGIAESTLCNATRRGEFKTRSRKESIELLGSNRGRTHTEETKAKISAHRRAFLEANPHMVPYRLNHHSKGPSYPEKYFTEVLDNAGIEYQAEYQVGLYSLDFAFPDRMIDLEIHGSQHYCDPRIVESDIRRRAYLEGLGWTVIEVNWSDYQKLTRQKKEEFISGIVAQLSEPSAHNGVVAGENPADLTTLALRIGHAF